MSPDAVTVSWASASEPFDLLRATGMRQSFAPHSHPTYALGVVTGGAHRTRFRGSDTVVEEGSVITIDPEEVHTGEPGGQHRLVVQRDALGPPPSVLASSVPVQALVGVPSRRASGARRSWTPRPPHC